MEFATRTKKGGGKKDRGWNNSRKNRERWNKMIGKGWVLEKGGMAKVIESAGRRDDGGTEA